MSSVCYVHCLSVQGLSCLVFVCPGFDVLPVNDIFSGSSQFCGSTAVDKEYYFKFSSGIL